MVRNEIAKILHDMRKHGHKPRISYGQYRGGCDKSKRKGYIIPLMFNRISIPLPGDNTPVVDLFGP